MARKPDIQYIGEFYTYGSEARKVELQPTPKKENRNLPKPVQQKKVTIYVDPVALVGIVVAVAMVILMAVSMMQYMDATEAHVAMEDYVRDLRDVNIKLTHDYRTQMDLQYVEDTARAIGMVPASEVEVMTVNVTVPQPEPERTVWDDIQWFLDGLFA